MNEDDPVFSHQCEVVRRLAKYFNEVRVVTHSANRNNSLPSNVTVYMSNWTPGENLPNIKRFLKSYFEARRNFGKFVIFSHMTEVQSAIVAPLSFLLNIPHYLWYAHKSHSIFLKVNHFLIDGIITSTKGSCPISGKKVKMIGQGIDEGLFANITAPISHSKDNLTAVHVGRLDPSKRIQDLIDNTVNSKWSKSFSQLILIGEPTIENTKYKDSIISANRSLINSGKIVLRGRVSRELLPVVLAKCDVFVHAFEGSLDKSLVEATMLGIPVVTSNKEYQRLFGNWRYDEMNESRGIREEMESFISCQFSRPELVELEVARKRLIALEEHSLTAWIEKIVRILNGRDL
jgi:glycosyltransferase involved in cell wall biosynthesis